MLENNAHFSSNYVIVFDGRHIIWIGNDDRIIWRQELLNKKRWKFDIKRRPANIN